MKVHIVGPSLDVPGGVANYCRLMMDALDVPVTYHVIGRRMGEKGRWAAVRRVVSDYWLHASRLRRIKPDVIHFNPSLNFRALAREALLLQLSRYSGARKLVFVHGWNGETASRLQNPVLRCLMLWAFRSVDCFIVLCAEHRDALVGLGIEAPIHIETVAVPDAAGRTGHFRTSGDALRILFLSRIEAAKGVLAAIQTHKLLLGRGCDVELVVAGDGPELEAARCMVANEGIANVAFPGYINGEAKHHALSNASLFLFPTRYGEGLPTCVLEAMTYGLPVITTPVGGIRDFFEHGKMGFLTTDTQPAALASLVDEITSDPVRRAEMSRYNEAYARQRFNASAVSRRLTGIYMSMVGRNW